MSVCYCYVRDSRMYRLVPATWKGMILREGAKREEGQRERLRGGEKETERGEREGEREREKNEKKKRKEKLAFDPQPFLRHRLVFVPFRVNTRAHG